MRTMTSETIAAIFDLGSLADNWDSYGARDIDPQSIGNAMAFVAKLSWVAGGASVGATPRGNVQLSWQDATSRKFLDLEFLPSGWIDCAFVDLDADQSYDFTFLVR